MRRTLAGLTLALALCACDRNIEPYDPNERSEEPDLSKIFPEGAKRAANARPELPPRPGSVPAQRGAPPVASSAEPLRGTVRLGPELSAPQGAVLFIVARRPEGGPPLAVKRVEAPRFPFEFALGPDDRMIAAMPFSGPLLLTARIDRDGNAMSRSAGDLQGAAAGTHSPGANGIEILLDEVL